MILAMPPVVKKSKLSPLLLRIVKVSGTVMTSKPRSRR
jgi:hypothetical protein